MNVEGYISRMKEATHKEFEQMKQADENHGQPTTMPVDLYRQYKKTQLKESKKSRPNGSARTVMATARAVADGVGAEGLAKAYRRAKGDSDSLYKKGEYERAKMVMNAYKEEHFLPAVELVANAASPDELLNSQQALSLLDEYAPIFGSGKGYTATYIKNAYANQLGEREGVSDASVREGVRQLNAMLDAGELRMALGLAKGLKRKIDNGDAMADDSDYDLIGRVVAFYA